MPNYNQLILTAAEYTFFLNIPGGGTYKLLTLDNVDITVAAEEELIYAVGEEDAVGNKQNARKITGKLSLQIGEIGVICEAEGLSDAVRIQGATLACVAVRGGIGRTLKQLNINSEAWAIKRRDKESISSLDFTALMVA